MPLVLVGGPVRRVAQLQAEHVDVAPTISALLGLPLPATNEGKVLSGALQLDPGLRARLLGMQKNQSRVFALIRRGVLAGTEQQAMDRLRSVRSPIARRLGLGLLFLLAWLFVSVFETPAQWRGALVALVVFYLTYSLLLDRFGLGYSLSMINREEYLESFLLKNMLLGRWSVFGSGLRHGPDIWPGWSSALDSDRAADQPVISSPSALGLLVLRLVDDPVGARLKRTL